MPGPASRGDSRLRALRPHTGALLPNDSCCPQSSPQPLHPAISGGPAGDGCVPEPPGENARRAGPGAPSRLRGPLPILQGSKAPLRGGQRGRGQKTRCSSALSRRWCQELRNLGGWAFLLLRRKSSHSPKRGPPAFMVQPAGRRHPAYPTGAPSLYLGLQSEMCNMILWVRHKNIKSVFFFNLEI